MSYTPVVLALVLNVMLCSNNDGLARGGVSAIVSVLALLLVASTNFVLAINHTATANQLYGGKGGIKMLF